MAQKVKNRPAMRKIWVQSLGQEDPLEKSMATHSSILAWKTPWTEEPNGLPCMGSQSQTWKSASDCSAEWSGSVHPRLCELSLTFWNLWFQHMCSFLTIEVSQDQARSALTQNTKVRLPTWAVPWQSSWTGDPEWQNQCICSPFLFEVYFVIIKHFLSFESGYMCSRMVYCHFI